VPTADPKGKGGRGKTTRRQHYVLASDNTTKEKRSSGPAESKEGGKRKRDGGLWPFLLFKDRSVSEGRKGREEKKGTEILRSSSPSLKKKKGGGKERERRERLPLTVSLRYSSAFKEKKGKQRMMLVT